MKELSVTAASHPALPASRLGHSQVSLQARWRPMSDGQRCEHCGSDATTSITDGRGRVAHHYCAQHVPNDLSGMIDEQNRRQRESTVRLAEMTQALRTRYEQEDMDPARKAEWLSTLDTILELCKR
jgi:hypothetical protein